MLDIDRFKFINDLIGYEQGNQLLKHIASVLTSHIQLNEAFVRISGDKFYILLEYKAKEILERRLEKITENILNFKFTIDSHFNIVICSGIYLIKNTEMTLDTIIDLASIAADMIKGSHTSAYYFYNDELRNLIIKENEIENEMHEAFENEEFKIYLQPKYDFKTEEIAGAEALIRWQHPKKGNITPDKFIPLFEKNGFVTKIDMYVFEEICKLQKEWAVEGENSSLFL